MSVIRTKRVSPGVEYLQEHYVRNNQSTVTIAKALSVSRGCVSRWLAQHGIRARTKSQAVIARCGPAATREDRQHYFYLLWLAFPELRGVPQKKWYDANRRKPKKTPQEKLEHKRWRIRRNHHKRKLVDPGYRIRFHLSNRIRDALKGRRKSVFAMTLLGCSMLDFRIYLESKWEPGMTWENYGSDWHIDHIMPCAIFDLTKLEHQKRCFHFSNMQPLWAKDNLEKNDKVLTNQFQLL